MIRLREAVLEWFCKALKVEEQSRGEDECEPLHSGLSGLSEEHGAEDNSLANKLHTPRAASS